jgi:dihydroorotate dehydrogenase electron transfer subunit
MTELLEAEVLSNELIMPETHVIRLASDHLATARAGQFVHIRCGPSWDPLLRRPMSVFRVHEDGASLMVREVGEGSTIIATSNPGATLDVLGPLGRPFDVWSNVRRVVMVGGGYGVAPLLALADQLLPSGREVVLLVGAATADHVFPSALVPAEVEYGTATMDGGAGHHGFVTELLPTYLEWAEAVYACGPTPMLEAVARCAAPARFGVAGAMKSEKPIQLAMEQHMGCAMGVCLGCVVTTRRGFERVCRDGPVFDALDLVWG